MSAPVPLEDLEATARALPVSDDPVVRFWSAVADHLAYDPEWREVTRFEPTHEDGRMAVLDVMRMPALCWRVRAGDVEITTGNGEGMAWLAYRIAEAIAAGMLGFHTGAPGKE